MVSHEESGIETVALETGLSKDEDGFTVYIRDDDSKVNGWKNVDCVWYFFDDLTRKVRCS